MNAVTVKGQVTIPKRVRERLGLKPGDEVAFEVGPNGGVMIRKADGKAEPSRFERMRGRAGKGPSTAQIMALTRGE